MRNSFSVSNYLKYSGVKITKAKDGEGKDKDHCHHCPTTRIRGPQQGGTGPLGPAQRGGEPGYPPNCDQDHVDPPQGEEGEGRQLEDFDGYFFFKIHD